MLSFLENPKFPLPIKSKIVEELTLLSTPIFIKEKSGLLIIPSSQHYFHFVLNGVLRCYSVHQEQEWTRWFFSKGDLALSVDGFMSGTSSDEKMEASPFSEIWAVEKSEYLHLLGKYPELKSATYYLIDNYLIKRREYDYKMHFLSSDQRYEWFTNEYPYVTARVQLQHLANFLGHTAQSLSRTRSRLQKKEILK